MLTGSRAPDLEPAQDKYLSLVSCTRGAFHSTWHAVDRPQQTHECVNEWWWAGPSGVQDRSVVKSSGTGSKAFGIKTGSPK